MEKGDFEPAYDFFVRCINIRDRCQLNQGFFVQSQGTFHKRFAKSSHLASRHHGGDSQRYIRIEVNILDPATSRSDRIPDTGRGLVTLAIRDCTECDSLDSQNSPRIRFDLRPSGPNPCVLVTSSWTRRQSSKAVFVRMLK